MYFTKLQRISNLKNIQSKNKYGKYQQFYHSGLFPYLNFLNFVYHNCVLQAMTKWTENFYGFNVLKYILAQLIFN